METKICYKCKKELPIDNFYKDNSQKDKLGVICKRCIKDYQEKNKDKIRTREKSTDKKNKYMKIYRSEHKDKIKELKKSWYEKNKDRKIIRDKKYKAENKDKITEYQK